MANYTSAGIARVARYLNRQLLETDTVKTAYKEHPFLDDMMKKAKKNVAGFNFEVSTRRLRTTDTFKSFDPWADESDFVGDDPNYTNEVAANAQANTYTRKDPSRNLEVKMSFTHDEIRVNEIEMAMIDSPGKFVDYWDEQLGEMADNYAEHWANLILTGRGDGRKGTLNGVAAELYGLNYQVQAYQGTGGVINDDPTNTHFGLKRHEFPNLVGNLYDAGQVDVDGASVAVTVTSAQLDPGENLVDSFPAADFTNVRKGWMVEVWNAAQTTLLASGREFRVGAVTSAAGQTSFAMTQVWRQAQVTDAVVILRPPFLDVAEGDANEFHVNKLHKIYMSCVDGARYPDWGLTERNLFTKFLQHLENKQRWVGKDADLENRGIMNFMFNQAKVIVDNHVDRGRIDFKNTRWCRLYLHRGYNKPQLGRSGLVPIKDGRRILSLAGDLVMAGMVVDRSPGDSAAGIGFNV